MMEKKSNPSNSRRKFIDESRLSPSKKRLFFVVSVVTPILVLVAAEILLRAFRYDEYLDSLVSMKKFHGKEYYAINPEISKRYFASHNVGVPEPYEEVFEVHKSPKTFRVFCLGESTMYGYPYPSNATAPRYLRDRLAAIFPDRTIEVVNLGIPAISSAVVLDILREAVKYHPDACIIYSGHNEFYGTYGVASTEYLAQNQRFLDFYMCLRKMKLFQLVRKGILAAKSIVGPREVSTRRSTFLERMVEDKYIPYGGSKYLKARELFKEDLREMVSVSKAAGVPIFFCTLVSNWKDLAPFISMFSPLTPDADRQRWEKTYERALELQRSGMNSEAMELFRQAVSIDSMRADAHYHLAQCYMGLNQFSDAATEFLKAKDLDVLRFRATSEFNDIVRRTSALDGAGLVDVEKVFVDNSPDHILGDELITEHLHPNERGYFLMGKAFCQALADHGILANRNQWTSHPQRSDEELMKMAAVTNLDLETANIRVGILKSAWPFRENQNDNFVFTPSGTLQSIAYMYCQKELGWDDAHYRMASYYIKEGKFEDAAREYETVAKELFLFYHPLMLLGDMQVLLRQYNQADTTYHRALELDDNQFVQMRLGTLYLQRNEGDRAISHLTESLRLDDQSSKKMTEDVRIIVLRELALLYEEKGAIDSARTALQNILAISPNNQTAREYLNRLGGQ